MTTLDDETKAKVAFAHGDGEATTLTNRPRRSWRTFGWREMLSGGLWMIAAVLTPLISYAGQLGLAALAGLLGIAALALLGRRSPPLWGLGLLFALAVWSVISLQWSVALPLWPSFHRYKLVEEFTPLKLICEFALYGALVVGMRDLSERAARRGAWVMAAGLILISLLMCIDAFTGGGVYTGLRLGGHMKIQPELIQRNAARGCYTVALLFWPAMVRLNRGGQRILQGLLAVAFVVAAIGLRVDAPVVALALSTLAFFAVRQFGRPAVWVLMGLTVLYFALAPEIVSLLPAPHLQSGSVVKASWIARLVIWKFAAGQIPSHLILGWGIDASRMWPDIIPLHPHNAAMQIWLELGAVGVGLALVFWAWLFERVAGITETDRTAGAAGAAVAVAYLTIGALSFGVWQEWWLGLGALAAVAVMALAKGRASDPRGAETSGDGLAPIN